MYDNLFKTGVKSILNLSRTFSVGCQISTRFGVCNQSTPRIKLLMYHHRWTNRRFEIISTDHNFPQRALLCLLEILNVLKGHKLLRKLSIQLQGPLHIRGDPILDGFVSLRGFKNLTLLEIFGIRRAIHNQNLLIKNIASVLHDCPQLKTFGIGMYTEMQNIYITTETDQKYFFKDLCVEYSSQSELAPLSLEILRLGFGMFILPWDLDDDEEDGKPRENFLAKFADLNVLQTFHIYNGLIQSGNDEEGGFIVMDASVDWTLLEVKSLRQLSVTILNNDVLTFLNFGARCVEELIITTPYSPVTVWYHRMLSQIATNLTTVVTWEPAAKNETQWEQLAVSRFVESWSGIPVLEKTILDVLGEGHISQIERLSTCLEFSQQWVSITTTLNGCIIFTNIQKVRFQSHLKNLPNLTELRLSSRGHTHIQYPARDSSLWSGISASKDLATHYAQLAKWSCPSLKRIRIGQWGWDVNFFYDEDIPAAEIHTTIRLREMEQSEMMSVELFAINSAIKGSGLPDLESWNEVFTDEECERWERDEGPVSGHSSGSSDSS